MTQILVVMNTDLGARALIHLLEPVGEVTAAKSSDDAIPLARMAVSEGKPYDLICLDAIVKGVHGVDILEEIRQAETVLDVETPSKVLFIATPQDREAYLPGDLGFDEAFAAKPFSREDILDAVESLGFDCSMTESSCFFN